MKKMSTDYQKKRAAIEETLNEAKKGEFISEERIRQWVSSWGTSDEKPPPLLTCKITGDK